MRAAKYILTLVWSLISNGLPVNNCPSSLVVKKTIANGTTKQRTSTYLSITLMWTLSTSPFAFSTRANRRAFNCSGVMFVVAIGICVFRCMVIGGGTPIVAVCCWVAGT